MQLTKLPIIAFLLAFGASLSAQDRYLEPVFTQASKTTAFYGSNFTILPVLFGAPHTVRQPLQMNVYTPVGDTKTDRPLIIYLHTGNFFPFPQNGSCGGALNAVQQKNRLFDWHSALFPTKKKGIHKK